MSLRVLLADESDTIKKVFQLALQDLNAEIKSVHSGLDVIDVAQSFQPHIIFADVLLQKKNGYDTCREIKQNPNVKKVPVVLMWSSFMELDQDQFKKSQADDQLEKPFDADFLRELIRKYAPQTQENPLGQFLNFPKSISAEATPPKKNAAHPSAPVPLSESALKEDTSEFNIGAILDDKFNESAHEPSYSMTGAGAPEGQQEAPVNDEAWMSADLSKFKIDLDSGNDGLEKFEALNLGDGGPADAEPEPFEPPKPAASSTPVIQLGPATTQEEDEKTDDISVNISNPLDQILEFSAPRATQPGVKTSTETKTRHSSATPAPRETTRSGQPVRSSGMSDDEIEAIIRAHTEEIIKTQVSETLTEVIERIVRVELTKILEEEVRLKQELNGDNV